MPKILVTIPDKVNEAIEKEAEKMGLSKSAFVRYILIKHLEEKGIDQISLRR